MGNKDHLTTPDETQRKQKRDLKRVVSNNFHSPAPVLTRGIDQIGLLAKTVDEVQDVSFPLLEEIEDLTDNIQTVVAGAQATITLQLDKANAQFQRLKLDDVGGTITSFIIDMTNLAKDRALEFITDIETVFSGTPTIQFQENGNNITVKGLPTAFGDTGTNEFKFQFSAIDTPIVQSYEIIGGGGGGTGQTPWTSRIDAAGNTLANLLSLDIEDSAGATKGSISGPLGVGLQIAWVTGDELKLRENINDVMVLSNITGVSFEDHELFNVNSIIPFGDNVDSVGTSIHTFNNAFINRLDFLDTTARSSGDNNFRIFRDTNGMIWQLGLEGTIEFGQWAWVDKDNVTRVLWDVNSTGKNFQYNFATGGFKIRTNATDAEGLLLFPRGNSFSTNDMIINANFAFGAGQGLLFQRNGVNKMRIAEDIFMFDDVNMGGNLLLNVGDITTASGASEIGTSVVGFDTIHVENVTFDSNTGIALGTFGISIFANASGDDLFLRADDTVFVQSNSIGSLGFFGTSTSNTKQTITGSRGGNAALADLLTKLALYNIIVDNTT